MRWSTAEKVNAAFAVALGMVAIIGLASITSLQRFASTAQDVNRTWATLTELQNVLTELTTAESAERGYVITGDDRYIARIDTLTRRTIERIHQLREQTFSDNEQQSRLAALSALVLERVRTIHDVAAARRDGGAAAAAELVEDGRGGEVMEAIQALAAEFEQVEVGHLEARTASATNRARVATAIIAAGGLFAFLIVLASGTLIRRDYTERRRAELALRESETLLSQFMENLPMGVIVVDADGRTRFANNAAVDILGPTILIDDGVHPLLLYRSGDHAIYPEHETPLALALAGRTSTADDAEVRVGNRFVPIQVSAAPIYDASGRIAFTIAAFRDETGRRQAELAMRAAKDAAEMASRTKSDFLARMSHELRTPLNSVIGFAGILLKNKGGNLHEQDVAYLKRIQDNGRNLLLLINDILDLSKIEAGKVDVETEPIDLYHLISDVAHQFEVQLRDRPVELRLEIPVGMAAMQTDPARLRQVLFNLIGNAVKFTERGHVAVAVDDDDGKPVRIRVSDTGIGIPEDRLDAIFDAFEQAESSTSRKYGGTGLGLPISHALCELLGYSLIVRSRVGEGTEFSVGMARNTAAGNTAAGNTAAEMAGAGSAGAEPADSKRAVQAGGASSPDRVTARDASRAAPDERLVLIIDDEADSRVLIAHYIEEFGGRAIAAHSAPNALKLARELRPDLITLDLVMPGLDGWSLLSALKEDPDLASIPVVVVSVVANENRATLLGAIDLLQKPVERDALFSVLRRNLGIGPARVLVVDDSPDARELLENLIAEHGAEVQTASNGREAWDMLENFDPDIVLLDLLMPVMDGLTFLEMFRATPRFQHVPVIVVSARDLTDEERDRLNRHTAAVLEKGSALENDLTRVLANVLVAARGRTTGTREYA